MPCLDEAQNYYNLMPISNIYHGDCGARDREPNSHAFKKAIKWTFALQGEVSSQQITDNLTMIAAPRKINGNDIHATKNTIVQWQGKNMSSTSGWLVTYLQGEITLENFKLHMFNVVRLAAFLTSQRKRDPGRHCGG
jgi:hypothetical protein